MTIKAHLQGSLLAFLSESGYRCFPMGSLRFGYSNRMSDIDVCVYAANQEGEQLNTILRCSGFQRATTGGHIDYPGKLWASNGIHIVVIDKHSEFECLLKEHDRVQNYITNNPAILDMARELHSTQGICGKLIYRTLVALTKSKPPVEPEDEDDN